MKVSPINCSQNFRANESANTSPAGSSSMNMVASNAVVGVAVGTVVGAARCALPVSKNEVAKKLTDALMVYKKAELPLASEVSSLSKQLEVVTNNNQWLGFIKNVEEMADDAFTQSSSKLARSVGLSSGGSLFGKKAVEEVVTKDQIINAAKKNLIGDKPVLKSNEFVEELGKKLTQKAGELFEQAKQMIKNNPKDELVLLSKKVAKKARDSKALSSSIRFGLIAAMVFCVMGVIQSNKKSE